MLSAGMGDSTSDQKRSPTDRLKEALCSKTLFQQYYLELAELAMGTYKHVGHLRSARLIGRDLAAFYSALGEAGKAGVFLTDALRSYEEQGWPALAAQCRLELAAAAKQLQDLPRYTKLSATIASTAELEIMVRNYYFEEMIKSIAELKGNQDIVLTELSDCFNLVSVTLVPSERGYITDAVIECCVTVESKLPKEVLCTRASISIEEHKKDKSNKQTDKQTPVRSKTDISNSSNSSPKRAPDGGGDCDVTCILSSVRLEELKPKNPLLNPLNITSQLHYKEDKSLQKATVECINPKATLKRSDSGKYRKPSTTQRNDFTDSFKSENFTIKPGFNELKLKTVSRKSGTFTLGQFSLLVDEKLEFLSNELVATNLGYEALTQGVNVYLNKVEPKKDLVAGLEHSMELVVTSGSSCIEENATITLKASTGLQMRLQEAPESAMSRELSVVIPPCAAFETTRVPLRLFASVQTKNKEKSCEHTVWLACPWREAAAEVPLHFTPPLVVSKRLLTSNTRKFLQVTLRSNVAHVVKFLLTQPQLVCDGNDKVSDLNPKGASDMIVSSDGTTASFIWELLKDPLVAAGPLKATFSVQYKLLNSEEPSRAFTCPFDIQDYTTLFVIRTKLEPSKGTDFCRASQMCNLHLSIQRVNETEYTSLMYEVLADQTMWAVLGRTAGVVTMEADSCSPQSVTLEVMPLVAGHLPLPAVRLSKYIAANTKEAGREGSSHPRLEPLGAGQVYHAARAQQVHVLPAPPPPPRG